MSAEKFFARIGLAVSSTALFLVALEGSVRILDRLRAGVPVVRPDPMVTLYRPHPYLPIALKPESDYRDGDTAGHINALGLRGPERTIEKSPGTFRVLCVGGSTTFGAGIIGDENTWPARLEVLLAAARPGLRVEVWNAGVPGYTTAENVIYLSLRLIDYHPDLVLFYEGYNDFKPNRYPGFESDYSHWRDRSAPPRRSWLEHWRLYEKMRALVQRTLKNPDTQVLDPRTGERLRRYDTVAEEGLSTFRRNLRTMIAVARSSGAEVALATYAHPCTADNLRARPDLFTYLPGYLPNLTFAGVLDAFDRYNETIRDLAASEGATLVDAARQIPQDPDLFVDHVHYNARGADAFARVVAAALKPKRPAPSRAPDEESMRAAAH